MTEAGFRDVCAVVVTYHPDLPLLSELLAALCPQVGAVIVVDNTGGRIDGLTGMVEGAGGTLLAREGNLGLASAQNLGIGWAREHGFAQVLLSDQDSVPAPGMVAALQEAIAGLGTHTRIAAAGPVFRDLREDRQAPFVRIGFPFNRKLWCESSRRTIACDFLISSGTLIPLAVIDAVGPMNEGLFIDSVDLEWSFRARARGYTLHGVCAAAMHHHLGDARRSLPFGIGQIVVHGPQRLYYMMRNRLRLYGMPHTPRIWVAQDVPRMLVKFLLFGVFVGPRWRNLRYMARGVLDGIRGRSGACPLHQDP